MKISKAKIVKHKIFIGIVFGLTATIMCSMSVGAKTGLPVENHTEEEIRQYLENSGADFSDPVTYQESPSATNPYASGRLSDETLNSALAMFNQIRYIAGIPYNATLDEEYNNYAQTAALLDAANNQLSHTPARPAGISDDLYETGTYGALRTNLALNPYTLNKTLVHAWMNDSDIYNIKHLGHRRWIISPTLKKTGFGVVGNYKGQYVQDNCGDPHTINGVAWPAQVMPVEYFSPDYAWSLSMNQQLADINNISVKLVREKDGHTWKFSAANADGEFYVDNGLYPKGGCIIFRPEGITGYTDGDVFTVTINGLSDTIEYKVDFFNLTEVEKVEVKEEKMTISVGTSVNLPKAIITPSGVEGLTASYAVEDTDIASVDSSTLKIYGKKAGETILNITCGDKSVSIPVYVWSDGTEEVKYIPTGKVENSGLLELDMKDLNIDVQGQGPLLENKKFKLNFSKLKIDYEIEVDGTIKISGGTKTNVVRNKKEWEKLKNYINASQEATKINDSFQKNLVKQSNSQSLFSEDMECSVALYAEGKANEEGKFKCKEGGLKISFKTPKLEYGQQFLVSGTIPVYLEGSLTIGGDLKAKVTIDENRMGYSGNFTVEVPKIELSGAVGTKNVRGGAKGEVTNKLELVSNTNGKANTFTGTLEGTTELFLEVFFFETSTKLWEGKAQYYPELTYEVDSDLLFKPMKTYACEMQKVQSSSGNSFVFYNDIVGERTSGNQNAIFYSVKKGNTTISPRKLLDDDGTSDYVPIGITSTAKNYAAGKAEDYVYVSWMNANREFTVTEVESKNNVTTIAKNCEICVAKIDGKTGELVKKYVIESTVDDKYDYLPSIAVTDQGIPFVAWAKNSADDPLTMCGTNEVFMAIYDSGTDTFVTQSVPVNSANWRQYPITNIEASYDGIAHKLLADVTFNCGEGGQKTKRMKSGSFLTQWSSVEENEVTLDKSGRNSVSGNTTDVIGNTWEETDLFELDSCMDIKKMQLGDKEVMTWYAYDEGQAASILYYDEDAKAVKTLVSSNNTVSSDYSIVNGENTTLVLMTEAMNTDGTSNICAVEIGDGKESAPFVLASVEGEIAYPNGAYDESTGKLTVSYYRYANEEWILETKEVNEDGKLEIENITYPPLEAVPGAKVDFDVTVKNTGSADVSDYSVYIYEKSSDDASEEVLLASKSEINLARGASSTVSLSAVIPSNEGKKATLIVKVENVDAANVEEEYPITICYPDLELQSKSDEQSVVLLTENISNYDVEQVNLNVYATNKEGELLETKELGAVSAGEVIETVYTLENLEVYDCEDLYFEVFSDEEELTIVNNGCYVNIGEEEKKSYIGIVAEAGDSFATMHVGDSIDLDSVTVYAVYSDGSAEKVTEWTSNVSEIDMNTEGLKKLVLTYQHGILKSSYEIPFQVETVNLSKDEHLHNYEETSFNWAEDAKSCTVTFTCKNDASHTASHDATVTSAVKTEATCKEKGITTYTATYTDADKVYSAEGKTYTDTKDVADIPVDSEKHVWDAGVMTKKPIATGKGEKTYTCKVCKATKKETIAALGAPKKGAVAKSDKAKYKVTKSDLKNGTAAYVGPLDKKATKVTIPATVEIDGVIFKVTSIEKNAFKNNKKVKTVTIGKNVTSIGDNAFYKCTALTKISIPSKVKTIGKNAFYGCKKMTSATIGKNVSKIGSKAFYGCSKLKTLKIKTTKLTTKKIGSKAFSKTPKSIKITIPKKKFKTYKSMLIKKGVNKKAKFKKG